MATKLTLLSVLLLASSLANSQHTELFYNGFLGATNITTKSYAAIEPNGIIRLTNDTPRVMGYAFYSQPIQFKNSTASNSFSTAFAFAITSVDPKQAGHGFAFVISPFHALLGAYPGKFLGLLNPRDGKSSDHLFAVEFDTVQDHDWRDINDNHVGINLNSMESNKSVPASHFIDGSTKQDLNLKQGQVIQAWVDYNSSSNKLDVRLSKTSSKPISPILSHQIDLSPILKESMYVGFSSSTGTQTSSHYILGWSFKLNGEAKSLNLETLPRLPKSNNKNNRKAVILGVTISCAIMITIVAIWVLAFCVQKKTKNCEIVEPWEIDIGPRRFLYDELKQATCGFNDKNLVGFGGFGRVYKGVLPKIITEIAVKRISKDSQQGWPAFVSEIETIGRVRHKNLVPLLGWCRNRGELFLVYDFMPNGSLDKYLFDNPETTLSWKQRFNIIKGVALALLYLHEEWEQVVIHRDIKAGNVLLDSEMNGRLGDFGLAKLCNHGSSPSTTRVVGTLGYLAPELTRTGKPTMSSDIYAFGALLLEVVCGRRPFEVKALPEELILVDWVIDQFRFRSGLDVVDPKLGGEFDKAEVLMVLKLGLMCSRDEPRARPGIRQVVMCLEGDVATLPELW